MNLGLGNLITLKRWLVPGNAHADTAFNDALQTLGNGIARQLEKHCDRKFERTVGAQDVMTGDQTVFTLKRYPVEELTLLESRTRRGEPWVANTEAVVGLNEQSGLVQLSARQTDAYGLIRITYTGGYWYDTTEDGTGVLPNGATPLPEDLRLAWLQQCAHCWERRQKLGIPLANIEDGTRTSALLELDLLPQVKRLLQPYIRMQLT